MNKSEGGASSTKTSHASMIDSTYRIMEVLVKETQLQLSPDNIHKIKFLTAVLCTGPLETLPDIYTNIWRHVNGHNETCIRLMALIFEEVELKGYGDRLLTLLPTRETLETLSFENFSCINIEATKSLKLRTFVVRLCNRLGPDRCVKFKQSICCLCNVHFDNYSEHYQIFEYLQNICSLHIDHARGVKVIVEALATSEEFLSVVDFVMRFIHEEWPTVSDEDIVPEILLKQIRDCHIASVKLEPDVQRFCDILKQQYIRQPIVPADWPPRVGESYFGRLVLLETVDKDITPSTVQQKAWCMLRGLIDTIPELTEDNLIEIDDVLKPIEGGHSLRAVVDGPPGIGKTTLCRKLLNMWAKGELQYQLYDLVLYCPLRNSTIANASKYEDLFVFQCPEVAVVSKWLTKMHGKGSLIIFDGWDELSTKLKRESLAASIIRCERLVNSSVIVTSRTYASSSLLKLDSINRHIEVVGFSDDEIEKVIQGTVGNGLSKKLIDDLKVRSDVKSLCYIPLICSIVILVYRRSDNQQLPLTLTLLYEDFILQTVRRHIEIKQAYDIEPRRVRGLRRLPSILASAFKEICEFAYLSLKENNPKITFSSQQLQDCLDESIDHDYLGLITTFTVCDNESFQFLHLSIQEFLAAWWIAYFMCGSAEQLFNKHFDDDHFRMCLRFVAGLTHLDHNSYRQYFNSEVYTQFKRRPLFLFEGSYHSWFYRNEDIKIFSFSDTNHTDSHYFQKLNILLQLLFESQNSSLCEILAESIKDNPLCLRRVRLSLFDMLCFCYFLKNSNATWNHLDLWVLTEQKLQIFSDSLAENCIKSHCDKVEVVLLSPSDDTFCKLLHKSSFLQNIKECYFDIFQGRLDPFFVLMAILELKLVQILHLIVTNPNLQFDLSSYSSKSCLQLESHLESKNTLREMKFEYSPLSAEYDMHASQTLSCVISGVTRNQCIQSFSLISSLKFPRLSSTSIKYLLQNNLSMRALKLNVPDSLLPSPLGTATVNTPLVSLEVKLCYLTEVFLQPIQGLCRLKVHQPCSPVFLFQSHPNLQELDIILCTADSVVELFTLLQSNNTLKALRVEIQGDTSTIFAQMSDGLSEMLKQNNSLEILEIETPWTSGVYPIPDSYITMLANGLSHNCKVKEISTPVPLSVVENEYLFRVVSEKNNIKELKIDFTLSKSYVDCSQEEIKSIAILFYEEVLPLFTRMLNSKQMLEKLQVKFRVLLGDAYPSTLTKPLHEFLRAICFHPSLYYIDLISSTKQGKDFFMENFKKQEKNFINELKQQPVPKQLPIIKFT